MSDVNITKKPNIAVSNLASPKRASGTYKMTATWNVPSSLTKGENEARAESLEIDWILGIPGKDKKKVTKTDNERREKSSINLNSFKVGSVTYTRDSFYPVNKHRKLSYVTVKVTPKNNKGKGPVTKATRKFKKPKPPSIGAFSFDTETGRVSTTINSNEGNGYAERYDTFYEIKISDTRTGKIWTHNKDNKTTRSTSKTVWYDVSDYQQLSYSEYVKVKVTAYTRGFAGNSKPVSKSYYVSYPARASIEKIKTDEGKCTVIIKTNKTDQHPVDRVRLDYLANTDYENAEDIPAEEAQWTNTDIIDNDRCSALSIPVSDVIPNRGKYTWVRVTSWHANERVLFRYSKFRRLKELERAAPTATDDKINIISAVAGANGSSAVVLLGWNADGLDDSTGTELTWSDEEDTWKSTESPSMYTFDWSDGDLYLLTEDTEVVSGKTYYTREGSGTEDDPYVYEEVENPTQAELPTYYELAYRDSAEIVIKGLEADTKYYIKARRFLESDDGTTYSDYSNPETVIASETPESIVATCDRFVPSGSPTTIRWTFTSRSPQTSWSVVLAELDESGEEPVIEEGNTFLAEGDGSTGSVQIAAEDLISHATNNVLSFIVKASTGGDPVASGLNTITIIDPPTLEVTGTSLVSTYIEEDDDYEDQLQSSSFNVQFRSSRECDVILIVTSQGAAGQFPQGFLRQVDGDTVHSGLYAPDWDESNGYYTSSIDLPTGLDFWDLGRYTMSIVAVDRETQLRSEEVQIDFSVNWTNKAVDPYDAITLTVIDEVDESGDHTQAVQIDLTPPVGSNTTDLYDIYRMDVENPTLIGEGFPLTYTAVDEYAPFGSDVTLKYRIALRTEDGSVSFADVEYEAQCDNMRFDWSGGSLELPYGLNFADSFKKDVSIRKHMDGSYDGYWNNAIERRSSLSSDVIKIIQPLDVYRARQLARYAGPVFVRLPNGSAYEADVQVTDLSKKNEAIVSMAFDATEIGITDEFSLPIPYDLEEEEEGNT